ncbi:MAG: 5-(carboxyamino)imidazole ribonucleotide mutase [Chloroflexi bacterium]|nr:5-(carboxyamino)imidazole ribonucleotide mutase [Chloroflexota bacterium]|tara:strand:+ start:10523 stop:11023 length:501 start_codon:yes stop_codon:yes gene_type:complete
MNLKNASNPLVAVMMGSKTDWPSMKNASEILSEFNVSHEVKVLSAHRTPGQLINYVKDIEEKNFKVIIAGAGGAAHLAGVIAAHTLIPVLGVPMKSSSLDGLDSLLSTVQMPSGIPVATFGIGNAGASNAALMAVSILSLDSHDLKNKLIKFRENKAKSVLESELT